MSDWHDNLKFSGLLRRATRIAVEMHYVQRELTEAFVQRYGTTYSDIDEDDLIDTLNYGMCETPPSVGYVDKLMREGGSHE